MSTQQQYDSGERLRPYGKHSPELFREMHKRLSGVRYAQINAHAGGNAAVIRAAEASRERQDYEFQEKVRLDRVAARKAETEQLNIEKLPLDEAVMHDSTGKLDLEVIRANVAMAIEKPQGRNA